MNETIIHKHDPRGMRKLLVEFPGQVQHAIDIGRGASLPLTPSSINNVVVTGLGGSAIGGDLMRSFLSEQLSIPFIVNRHYFMPEFVDTSSLVVVSSYSGNTEETVAAHADAVKRKAKIFCISSNGKTEAMAKKYRQPIIKIPKGFPPRAALGYSFFPLLMALRKLRLIKVSDKDISETVDMLKRSAKKYNTLSAKTNRALRIAQQLHGTLPVVYSAAERFDVVNLRWRGQLAENAKVLAFGHVLPEMNHNELVGWNVLKRQMNNMSVILLRDKQDHKRVQLRMEITKGVIKNYTDNIIEVYSEGRSLLTRMFSLVYLGDWVSFYLAMLNRVDPTPVKVIDYLKTELGKVK